MAVKTKKKNVLAHPRLVSKIVGKSMQPNHGFPRPHCDMTGTTSKSFSLTSMKGCFAFVVVRDAERLCVARRCGRWRQGDAAMDFGHQQQGTHKHQRPSGRATGGRALRFPFFAAREGGKEVENNPESSQSIDLKGMQRPTETCLSSKMGEFAFGGGEREEEKGDGWWRWK
jgi:hypothetical protein